jgi:hypothetical protein
MLNKFLSLALLLILTAKADAQQFIGNSLSEYSAIQMMPYNPAWVCNAWNGNEILVMGGSALAGTNAFYFDRGWVLRGFNGQAFEGPDYKRDRRKNVKQIWANAEVLGPAMSFTVKNEHYVGFYTRYRQIVRGGNLSSSEIELLGGSYVDNPLLYEHPITIKNAGFSAHTFGEVGVTYGKILRNDDYHFLKAGASLKYLIGFSAASISTNSFTYERYNKDSIAQMDGDLTAVYTYNLNPLIDKDASNDFSSWTDRAGKGGLGIDLGVQYQYHPDGNPNERTNYLFSFAASLTDIGSVKYIADTGSASYEVKAGKRKVQSIYRDSTEDVGWYFVRQVEDSALYVNEDYQKFRMGLPTALRVNFDWNVMPKFNMAVNVLLNMRGSSLDNPSYVSYFNLTPTYSIKPHLTVGMPLTFIGRQTVCLGTIVRAGPLFVGSNTLFSSIIMAKDWIRNIDAYFGLSFKIPKADNYYRYR